MPKFLKVTAQGRPLLINVDHITVMCPTDSGQGACIAIIDCQEEIFTKESFESIEQTLGIAFDIIPVKNPSGEVKG